MNNVVQALVTSLSASVILLNLLAVEKMHGYAYFTVPLGRAESKRLCMRPTLLIQLDQIDSMVRGPILLPQDIIHIDTCMVHRSSIYLARNL